MRHRSNDTPILTIIIPSYNVEDYIEECLNSLIAFTYAEVEVLVINDGSTDNTTALAESYSKKYQHIKLISKVNGGHGSTINIGLQQAQGTYCKLLDGDDYVNPVALKSLVTYLSKTDADIVLNDYVEYYMASGEHQEVLNYSTITPDKVYNLNTNGSLFKDKGPLLATTTFRTALYKDSPFTLDEKCYYVDMEYNFFIYQRAKTLVYHPSSLYYYRLDRVDQSMQQNSLIKHFTDHEKVCLRITDELEKVTNKDPKYTYLFTHIVAPMIRSHYQLLIEHMKDRRQFLAFDKKLRNYRSLYHSSLISGKIIHMHRVGRGVTIKGNSLLRKIGGVKKRFEKKY